MVLVRIVPSARMKSKSMVIDEGDVPAYRTLIVDCPTVGMTTPGSTPCVEKPVISPNSKDARAGRTRYCVRPATIGCVEGIFTEYSPSGTFVSCPASRPRRRYGRTVLVTVYAVPDSG